MGKQRKKAVGGVATASGVAWRIGLQAIAEAQGLRKEERASKDQSIIRPPCCLLVCTSTWQKFQFGVPWISLPRISAVAIKVRNLVHGAEFQPCATDALCYLRSQRKEPFPTALGSKQP